MSSKVVSSDSARGDLHHSFYEGNHWNHYLSLLPICMPLCLLTIPKTYSWMDPILSPNVLYPLLGVYQTLKSTHSLKGSKKTIKELRGENKAEERTSTKNRKQIYGKEKHKDLWRLTAIRKVLGHMCFTWLRTYVMILCNWLILWQNALYLYFGRFRMCLNTSRNHVSKSSVEAFKSVQENKLIVQIH